MAFWDFWFKPKPDYWEALYRAEKSRADKLYYDLIGCQTENSRILSAARLAMEGRQNLENQISQLNAEIKVLRDDAVKNALLIKNQSTDLKDALEEIHKLLIIQKEKVKTIGELQARLANALVLDKNIELPTERAKAWWEAEKILWKTYGLPEVRGFETWTAQQVEKAIRSVLPNLTWQSPAKDATYRIISLEQMKSILENSFVNLKPYIADLHDCDKFAQELRAHFNKYLINSMIEVWGYWGGVYHSRNLIVCKDGVIDLVDVEPQNDQFGLYPAGIGDNFKPDTIHDW